MRLQLATIVPPNAGAIPEPDRTIHEFLHAVMKDVLHASPKEAEAIQLRMASILQKVTAIHDLAWSARELRGGGELLPSWAEEMLRATYALKAKVEAGK